MQYIKDFFLGLWLFLCDLAPLLGGAFAFAFLCFAPESMVTVVGIVFVSITGLLTIGLGIYCAYERGKEHREFSENDSEVA